MSVRKGEHWQVSWSDGRRPRSLKLDRKADAERLARELEREHRDGASIRRIAQWEVRWREGGRDSRRRHRTFDRKSDAETFDREVKRRKQLGELATWEKRNHTVHELGREWWANCAVPNPGRVDAHRLWADALVHQRVRWCAFRFLILEHYSVPVDSGTGRRSGDQMVQVIYRVVEKSGFVPAGHALDV